MEMDDKSRKNLEECEKAGGRPTGILRIERGECPRHATMATACTFCSFGHMLDCHYPQTCSEAECSHWKEQLEAEGEDPI